MQSKDLIKMNLAMSHGMMVGLFEDLKDAPLAFPTPNGGNHAMWIAGHLAYSKGSILDKMMLGEPNPCADWKEMFAAGTDPVSDAEKYPPYEDVLAKCEQSHEATMKLLDSMSEEDLDQKSAGCPPEYDAYFGTYRQCLQMAANHWLMHRGQLADVRRALGRAPLNA